MSAKKGKTWLTSSAPKYPLTSTDSLLLEGSGRIERRTLMLSGRFPVLGWWIIKIGMQANMELLELLVWVAQGLTSPASGPRGKR